ncbi:hypothetical protein BUALT_Bualt08G0055700 [Buddleja alternifolia]|uniref:Myb/SANT-like domain-containing protein n=1 Tax=Buddleja alternifolia TaxID=168488 RepID=A0AAV6XCH8_9LAMI|nr:hypothetical protein BUALT_Bualt08G0055700 [Buddleja alternifolia]
MWQRRFRFLFDRYTTFKQITEHPGVRWDQQKNLIFAQREVLKNLAKENPLVRAYVWNGEPAMVQFNAIFGPTIINVSSDSCRSCGEGPNDTIIVEDSEEADQISLSLENTLSKKGKGRLDHYSSSQGSSPFPPPRYGYAIPAPFPIPQYNFNIKKLGMTTL